MTPEQAIIRLKELQHQGDPEATHSDADEVLCQLLRALGHEAVVEEWDKVPKWYA
jgi:hypothetical protein